MNFKNTAVAFGLSAMIGICGCQNGNDKKEEIKNSSQNHQTAELVSEKSFPLENIEIGEKTNSSTESPQIIVGTVKSRSFTILNNGEKYFVCDGMRDLGTYVDGIYGYSSEGALYVKTSLGDVLDEYKEKGREILDEFGAVTEEEKKLVENFEIFLKEMIIFDEKINNTSFGSKEELEDFLATGPRKMIEKSPYIYLYDDYIKYVRLLYKNGCKLDKGVKNKIDLLKKNFALAVLENIFDHYKKEKVADYEDLIVKYCEEFDCIDNLDLINEVYEEMDKNSSFIDEYNRLNIIHSTMRKYFYKPENN